MHLIRQIMFRARESEDEPALATTAGIVSYRTLSKSVWSATQTLKELDLPPGSFVIVDVAQPLHQVYLILALALLGYPSASLGQSGEVPINGPKAQLVLSDRGDAAYGQLTARQVNDAWFAFDVRASTNHLALLALPGTAEDAVVRYIYSSGTTGHAKCVAYTAGLLAARVRSGMLSVVGLDSPKAATMNLMDLGTMSGILSLLRGLAFGGLVCLAPEPVAAIDMIRLFKVERLTASVGHLQTILSALRAHAPITSLRTVLVTGARLPLSVLAEARGKLCPDIIFAYGSTEAYLMAVGRGAVIESEGAVGYVLPGVGVEIVDEAGLSLQVGQEGLLRVQPIDAPYYVDAESNRSELLEDGKFYPGDIGRLQADGKLVLTGRSSDVINRGGTIIAPEVIEEAFRGDGRITDVAAVGVPQASGIDQIWVAIVAASPVDLQALAEVTSAKLGDKAPNKLVQVPEIPRNTNQKVRRGTLRDQLRLIASQVS